MPVVISITAAAATTSRVVLRVEESVMGGHDGVRLRAPEYLRGGRSMVDAPVNVTPVTTHYDALLAARYTWMMGGLDGCLSSARALLDAVGLTDEGHGSVLDLGAGAGYHARVLASRGFGVTAVDTSDTLLKELSDVCAGMPVKTLHADLLDESKFSELSPFELILCVGD